MRRTVLLSTVLLLAACGGGEDERAVYIAQASEVCEDAVADFEALTVPTTPDGFAPYAEQLVDIVATAEEDLSALTPPEEDRAELEERVLDPFSDLVDEGRAFVAEVEAAGTDQAQLLGLLSQRPTADEIDVEYLREYGLDSCAEAVEQAG